MIEQLFDSAAVRRRDEHQFVAAECVELGRLGLLSRAIDFVDRHYQRAPGFTHERKRFRVCLAQPAPAIEHEHDNVGDADRGQRLADDSLGHPLMPAQLQATAVDYDEFTIAVLGASEI